MVPKLNTGVLRVVAVVTVCVAVLGVLHPVAVAVITDVPFQPAAKVTVPVVVLMVLPPEMVVASRL